MVEQAGTSSDTPGETLDHFTRWDYRFTYSLPFHYPQDALHGEVHFNVRDTRQGDFRAVFQELAEFTTVFPAVNKDLRGILATIDANTTDQRVIGNAAIALTSFNQMVKRIVRVAQQNGGLFHSDLSSASPSRQGQLDQSYTFTIHEGCIQRDGVAALLIILRGQPPKGGAAPQVLIDPEKYDVQSFACDGSDCGGEAIQGDYCFWYKKKDSGQPLSAVEGQRIPAREVLLKELDLLAYQDAKASVSLRRNELPGRPVAEYALHAGLSPIPLAILL